MDSKGHDIRVRLAKFRPDQRGMLVRVGDESTGTTLEWVSLAGLPKVDPRRRGSFREIPALAGKLKTMGFKEIKRTWPAEFVRAIEILEPCLHGVLEKYSGASRWRVTKSLWERTAQVVLDIVLTHKPAELEALQFWTVELDRKISDVYRLNEDKKKRKGSVSADPVSPGEWFYHGAKWRLRIGQISRKYHIGGTKLKAVVAVSDGLFGLFFFKRARSLEKPISIDIDAFEEKIFFPSLEDAFKNLPILKRREAAPLVWEKEFTNQFEKQFYHALRKRFNGWRSKEKQFIRMHGGVGVPMDSPMDQDEDALASIDTLMEKDSISKFPRNYGPKEIQKLIKVMPKAGRTYRRFVKIEKTVPDWMGHREALSFIYQELEKETGVSRGTLRKQVHEAKKFLGRGTWKVKKNGRK